MASFTSLSSRTKTVVCTGSLPGGGDCRMDISRIPAMHMYIVRGIGVADKASTSIASDAFLIFSFCRTPKRCSSSTTSSPSRPHCSLSLSTAWVPTSTSIDPALISAMSSAFCIAVRLVSPDNISTLRSGMRSRNTRRCCAASTVVGARTATCRPLHTARCTARMAASVFPNPTSPQTRRSIGRSVCVMSRLMSSKQANWSGVGR
mmetsp:Transcript_61737/g.102686  ORF Transcript_61737/g.102686 Transcript_61737/m.102686 type:complete len:205 (-) Transcript_61737:198-812(-)